MKITRRSPLTGKINMREIDITEEQYLNWTNGMLIQNAVPNLSSEDHEFLISGSTPEDWKTMFSKVEE